jgi:DNA (cytosine-5)-methyltransferase 1
VLFEPEGMPWNPQPSRKARPEAARHAASGARGGGETVGALTSGGSARAAWRLGADEAAAGHAVVVPFDETQITHRENRSRPEAGDPAPSLAKTAKPPTIAFHPTQDPISGPVSPCLSRTVDGMGALVDFRVRRLTPRECERLQGFPDDYTATRWRCR